MRPPRAEAVQRVCWSLWTSPLRCALASARSLLPCMRQSPRPTLLDGLDTRLVLIVRYAVCTCCSCSTTTVSIQLCYWCWSRCIRACRGCSTGRLSGASWRLQETALAAAAAAMLVSSALYRAHKAPIHMRELTARLFTPHPPMPAACVFAATADQQRCRRQRCVVSQQSFWLHLLRCTRMLECCTVT